MKKIYFLSLVFTIGFCLVLGSCRSGNRKKQNVVATQTYRSNIRYAQGFWLEQHENYRLLHIKDPQSETSSEYTFALRQRGTPAYTCPRSADPGRHLYDFFTTL